MQKAIPATPMFVTHRCAMKIVRLTDAIRADQIMGATRSMTAST